MIARILPYFLFLLLFALSNEALFAQEEAVSAIETIHMDADFTAINDTSLNFVNPRLEYLDESFEQQRFETKTWQSVIQDYDYTNSREKDRDEAFDESLTNGPSGGTGGGSGFSFSSEFWSGFLKFILITAAIITMVFLMLNLLGQGSLLGPRNRKIKAKPNQITIENLEDNILESDLDRFIRTATEEQNYALAIRLYYLAIIKELSLKKSIKWKRDKTNRDYLREMQSNSLFLPFREATGVFERIWYGNIDLTEQDYLKVRPKFQDLIQTVQHAPKAAILS
ncbi:MAG: DUF4129 domain-containing protein [Saprospiraceae bacterium]